MDGLERPALGLQPPNTSWGRSRPPRAARAVFWPRAGIGQYKL